MTELRQLRRIRWGVRAVLALGVAASVTANVLHALPHPIAQAIAAWPPLALLLTVELISRVPVHRRSLAALRLAATAAIAGIAAWVSYWHMVGVAARYGETGAAPYLMPLSVDGLVVVASVCLVELAGRIRTAEQTPPVPAVAAPPVPVPAPDSPGTPDPVLPVPVQVPALPAQIPAQRVNGNAHVLNAVASDEELLAVLANTKRVPRDADGTVPVRRAARALGTGPDRARKLLDRAGLLATKPSGPAATGRLRPSGVPARPVLASP